MFVVARGNFPQLRTRNNFIAAHCVTSTDLFLSPCVSSTRRQSKVFGAREKYNWGEFRLKIKCPWHMFCFYFYHCKRSYDGGSQMKTLSTRCEIIHRPIFFFATRLFTLKSESPPRVRRGGKWIEMRLRAEKYCQLNYSSVLSISLSLSPAILKIEIGIQSSFFREQKYVKAAHNIGRHRMQAEGGEREESETKGKRNALSDIYF